MGYEEIENIDSLQYNAYKALILYSLSINNLPTVNASLPTNYVSIHEIRNNILCEGKPITKKALYNLCKAALPSLQIKTSYIPEKVIAYSAIEKTLIWWMPAHIKTLFFKKDTSIPSGKAPIPPLLFVYHKNRLMIYALKDNKRPVPETEIFNTPFFNSGCMGNVKLPEPTLENITKIENLFFQSEFTSDHPPMLKKTTGNKLWSKLIKNKKIKFPIDRLTQCGTVKTLLQKGIYE